MKTERGFTLTELLIAVAIVLLLVIVALPTYQKAKEKTAKGGAEADITQICLDLERYYATHGAYPASLAEIGPPRLDPWGKEYQYLNMSLVKGNGSKRKDHNLVPLNTDYDLYSMGPDGKSASPLTAEASRDDIIRANNGQFVGPASEY